MALTEYCENDKIEVIGKYKTIQIRCATVIERDGVEINRSFHRHSLVPGILAPDNSLIETDLNGQDPDIAAVASAVWTTEVKEAWRQKLIADLPQQEQE